MSWNESAAAQTHPMIAVPSHDELVEQLFVRDLKLYVMQTLEPAQRDIASHIQSKADVRSSNNPVGDLREAMAPLESFKSWIGIKRESQRQLWAAVGSSVERHERHLGGVAKDRRSQGAANVDVESSPHVPFVHTGEAQQSLADTATERPPLLYGIQRLRVNADAASQNQDQQNDQQCICSFQ